MAHPRTLRARGRALKPVVVEVPEAPVSTAPIEAAGAISCAGCGHLFLYDENYDDHLANCASKGESDHTVYCSRCGTPRHPKQRCRPCHAAKGYVVGTTRSYAHHRSPPPPDAAPCRRCGSPLSARNQCNACRDRARLHREGVLA
jgi:hypothetical protein